MAGRPSRPREIVIHDVVQLAIIAFALSLLFAATSITPPAPGAAPGPQSVAQLPPTQPGLSSDEGVFLVTDADDGGSAAYFIAGNARHSILISDMQVQVQLNPLRPVHAASRDDVLSFPEGTPIGTARTGLLSVVATAEPDVEASAPDLQPVLEQPSVYVVKQGDNLTRLAAEYGTTIDAIMLANGLTNANRIYVGKALTIPSGNNVQTLVAESPEDQLIADAASGATSETTYTVQRGDSAIKIARTFGIDESALLDANGITNPNRVYVGQVLTIPS
jgi:LysM repeat protein